MALINCPGCGGEVSPSASACQKCGHPIAGAPPPTVQYIPIPAPKSGCFSTTTILLVVGSLMVLGCLGSCLLFAIVKGVHEGTGTTGTAGTGTTGAKQAKPEETVAATVDSEQLLADYEANEVSADQYYKGKLLEVRGTVDNIGKDIIGTMYVALVTRGRGIRQVQVYFEKSHANELASLRSGDVITIRGRCDGLMMNVLIKEGRFVK